MPGGGAATAGLEKLHDILLPDPVSWAPQTIGWYVVLGLILLLASLWVHGSVRHFSENRYRRLALVDLSAIERTLQQPEARAAALAALPGLLKRTALSGFPRVEVAALSGRDWLAFLDETMGGGKAFTEGEGRVLPLLAYAPAPRIEELSGDAAQRLVRLARRWISMHDSSDR
jgi:hypothetical protein